MITLILIISGLIVWEPERQLTYDQFRKYHAQVWAQDSVVHIVYDADNVGLIHLRSTDWGIHWDDPVIISEEYYGLAGMAFSDSVAYLAYSKSLPTGTTYVYFRKSTNYGQTWEPPESLGKGMIGSSGNQITAVEDTIFIGVKIRESPPSKGSYLYLSFDGGKTWQGPRYIEHSTINFGVNNILYKRGIVHTILVGTLENLPISNYYLYSSDFGLTWSDPFMLPDSHAIAVQCAKRLVGGPDNELFVVWDENTYSPNILFNDVMFRRSLDGGQTWEPIQRLTYDHSCDAAAAIDLVREDSILYLVWSHVGGWPTYLWFMASTNLGASWLSREDLNGDYLVRYVCNIASENNKVYVTYFLNNQIYIRKGYKVPYTEEQEQKLVSWLTFRPNPTADLLHFSSKTSDPLQIILFDNLGRRVREATIKDKATIDLRSIPSGVYFLRVRGISNSIKVIKIP